MGSVRFRACAAAVGLGIMLSAPASASARAPSGVTVTITSVSTADCYAVHIDYVIAWRGIRADTLWSSDLLVTYPGHTTLAGNSLDVGKANKNKGELDLTVTRESGYFDHQVYGPTDWGYQVAVFARNPDGSRSLPIALSNPVAMPNCVPLSPTTGPAAGGTTVTAYGGGTFGGDPFTLSTTVTIGATSLTPTSVSADGRSLTFTTPPGPAATCVPVSVAPGLPFSLPDFCYT